MTIAVIGVGNTLRTDDGIGPAAIQCLRSTLPQGVVALACRCEPAALIEAWRDASAAILVDAAAPAGRPGHITRVDDRRAFATMRPAASTHGFGLVEVLALARTLGAAPACVVIFAVEGLDFDPGGTLSPPVQAALPALLRAIGSELRALGATPHDVPVR